MISFRRALAYQSMVPRIKQATRMLLPSFSCCLSSGSVGFPLLDGIVYLLFSFRDNSREDLDIVAALRVDNINMLHQ